MNERLLALYRTYWLFMSGELESERARLQNLWFRRYCAGVIEAELARGAAT